MQKFFIVSFFLIVSCHGSQKDSQKRPNCAECGSFSSLKERREERRLAAVAAQQAHEREHRREEEEARKSRENADRIRTQLAEALDALEKEQRKNALRSTSFYPGSKNSAFKKPNKGIISTNETFGFGSAEDNAS